MRPVVSVIMSVYNGETHLAQAIESIIKQTYKAIEFIIIDDASTDNSPAILKEFAERDQRIRVMRNQENIGLTRSLNKGLRICHGEFIARQDADDFSSPERIAKQVYFMTCNPDVMLLGTSGCLMDEKGKVLHNERVVSGTNRLRKLIIKKNQFFHGSVMIRKSCLSKIGLYNEEFRSGQDYDLFLRIAENYAIENLWETLYHYRITSTAISMTKTKEQLMSGLIAQTASLHRRKGWLTAWEPGTFQKYEQMLDTFFTNRMIESNICLTKGRNNLLMNNINSARKEFIKAFIAFPMPKTLYHLIKSLFLHTNNI